MGTNAQENKQLSIVLAAAAISFALFFSNIGTAQNYASAIPDSDVALPEDLSDTDYDALKEVVLSDARVKEIIADQPYDVMSYDFISNANDNPVIWQPEIHVNVA